MQSGTHARGAGREDDIRRERGQFYRVSANVVRIARPKAIVDLHVAAVAPAPLLQRLLKSREAGLHVCIIRVHARTCKHTDTPHPLGLLRPRRKRPPRRRAAEQRDELAALHSITSSARASSVGGTSIPSTFAVLRLIIRSNLVGCSTGISAGLVPRRILS